MERTFRDHHALVYRAAYRITGNAADADDVTQVVFMRLLRREEGRPALSDTPGSYLHRAAVNAALDVVRSRRAARSTPLEDVAPALEDDSSRSPDRGRDAQDLKQALRRSLARQSPRAAEIFTLRYIEGLDNHEIARMLGISRTTVAVILHRTRARLRRDLEKVTGGSR